MIPQAPRARVAVVGIGNPLVGDDGAGIAVIEKLRRRWGADPRVLLLTLEGDLFEIGDHLERADRFLFADAVAGAIPGEVVPCTEAPRAFAPSFHQTDVGAVMRCLEGLRTVSPFPPWEIWGIVVDPPTELRPWLTDRVGEAVIRLSELLSNRLAEAVRSED